MRYKIKKDYFYYLVFFIIFSWSYYCNGFNVLNEGNFKNSHKFSDSLVVGKIMTSKQNGMFFQGGNLAFNYPNDYDLVEGSFYKYINNDLSRANNIRYNGNFGLQGMIFSLIDSFLININPKVKLNFYYFMNTVFLTLVLIYIVRWIYLEFGFFSILLTMISLLFSTRLVEFGRSLYWVTWTWFLPLAMSIYFLKKEENQSKYEKKKIFICLGIAILIKVLCGTEYISSILISTTIPYFYYSIKNSWGIKKFIKRFIEICLVSLFFVFLGILFTCIQNGIASGNIKDGFIQMSDNIKKRAISTKKNANEWASIPIMKESIEASYAEVISKYINGTISNMKLINFPLLNKVSILYTLFLLIPLSMIRNRIKDRKEIALTISVYLSFFASISWLVIAKPHSYIHTFNEVTWFISYLIFFPTYIGYRILLIFRTKNLKKRTIYFSLVGIIVITSTFITTKEIIEYKNILKNGIVLKSDKNMSAVIYKDNLYLMLEKNQGENYIYLHLKKNQNDSDFNNLDFYIEPLFHKISLFFMNKGLIVKRDIKNQSFFSLDIGGSIYKENKLNVLWEDKILVDSNYNYRPPKISLFSDTNWYNGMLKTNSKIILIDNNVQNIILLNKSKSVLMNNREYPIRDYRKVSEEWLNVELE